MTRVIRILGFLALATLASSFVYAGTFTCSSSSVAVSTICGESLVANRSTFDTGQVGYGKFDTVNWADNPLGAAEEFGSTPPCSNTPPSSCYNPDIFGPGFNSVTGVNTSDDTAYGWGQTSLYSNDAPANLGIYEANSFPTAGAGPSLTSSTDGILSDGLYNTSSPACTGANAGDQCPFDPGAAAGMYGLALTWDTSQTSPNPVSGVYGVGFDFQLGASNGDGGTEAATGYSVTFDIWAATSGCTSTEDNIVNSSSDSNPAVVNCFDYSTGDPTAKGTDVGGNLVAGADLTGSALSSALLAQITVTSTDGAAGFFSVTSSQAIGTIYAVPGSDSATGGEGTGAFGIDSVDLLSQESVPTPEPATLLLFGSGMLFAARRLRKNVAK